MFMDYFGIPNIPSHLRPFGWALNVPGRAVAIPGTGDEKFSVTYSKDLALFLDRLVDEAEWPEWSIISGADTCLNELVALAEKITGKWHGNLEYLGVCEAYTTQVTSSVSSTTLWRILKRAKQRSYLTTLLRTVAWILLR